MFFNSLKRPPDIATIALRTPRNGRRTALISRVLQAAKIEHQIVSPVRAAIKPGALEARTYAATGAVQYLRMPSAPPLLITDDHRLSGTHKTIRIDYNLKDNLRRGIASNDIFQPMMFHPDETTRDRYAHTEQLQLRTNRPIRILFAGNCDPALYANPKLEEDYDVETRHQLHKWVRALSRQIAILPETPGEVQDHIVNAQEDRKLVWIDTKQFRIPRKEWFETMASASFFVVAPGVRYPWCQNFYEAIACGTIPILQFPDLFYPPLIDGENAITFDAPDAFEAAIRQALLMDEAKVRLMRRNAIDYHNQHTSPVRVVAKIKDFLEDTGRDEMRWHLAGKG